MNALLVPRRSLLLALLLAPALARPSAAQVIAHPNQIVGDFGFSNRNPVILGLLNAPGDTPPGQDYGLETLYLQARSRPPAARLDASRTAPALSRLSTPYEITVESGPPGAGIAYDVGGQAEIVVGRGGRYFFLPQASGPVEYEPAPDVRLDVKECAGVIKFLFRDAGGLPVFPPASWALAYPEEPPGSGLPSRSYQASETFRGGQSEEFLILRGDGLPRLVQLRIQVGSDPALDLVIYGVDFWTTLDCDQVLELPITVLPADQNRDLGRIVGEFDILGEAEHDRFSRTSAQAISGPWDNFRIVHLAGTPASGPYELPNLVASDVVAPPEPYEVSATAWFRRGRRFEELRLPELEVLVPAGATVDLGEALVLDPGVVRSDIRLAGPAPLDPAIGATLEDLSRLSDFDADRDGFPDAPYLLVTASSMVRAWGVDRPAPGAQHTSDRGQAACLFEGAYDPAAHEFRGDAELLLGGLYREPSLWKQSDLDVHLLDRRTPGVPESYQDMLLALSQRDQEREIVPGATIDFPYHFCMNQVNLRFRSEGGKFTSPSVGVSGSYRGLDFELNDADYSIHPRSRAYGTPPAPPAGDLGLVVLTLPQGSFYLRPSIVAENPGGGTSNVQLNPVRLNLGCRQIYDEWIDFTLDLVSPLCTKDAVATLSGQVQSGSSIERIEYRVDGGPPTLVCSSCGVSPPFSFAVTLGGLSTDVEVTAVDALGRSASARAAIERAQPPGDLGNVLLAVKEYPHARFHWQPYPGARATELGRDLAKPFLAPTPVFTRPLPVNNELDRDAVTAPTPLHFYRVRGLNCAGEPGP